MHGHVDKAPLDYEKFFAWLGTLAGPKSQTQVRTDLTFVIESTSTFRTNIVFRVLSGDPDQAPLLVDQLSGEITGGDTNTWAASRTVIVVDPEKRLLSLEMRRAGVTDVNLQRFFSLIAREGGFAERLDLSLSPFAGPGFAQEIKQFERIKEAEIVVTEPNVEWLDSPDELSLLARSSGGRKAALAVTAAPNESLDKESGIVGLITDHAHKALPSLTRATVAGRKYGDDVDTRVSTTSHPLQRAVATKKGAPSSELEARLLDAAADLIEEAPTISHDDAEE